MTRNCEGCGHAFDERMMYQMQTSWVRRAGKARTTKGSRFEQRWACMPCVEAMARAGSNWQQLSLLDG